MEASSSLRNTILSKIIPALPRFARLEAHSANPFRQPDGLDRATKDPAYLNTFAGKVFRTSIPCPFSTEVAPPVQWPARSSHLDLGRDSARPISRLNRGRKALFWHW